jgi:hypothetical protein
MWHPFRRKKIEPVLVPEAEPPTNRSDSEVDAESLRGLTERLKVRMLVDSVHERLASDALAHIRGGHP